MSLDKRAVCSCLTRSQPRMKKLDQSVTSEIQVSHNAGRSSGRYNKELYTAVNRKTVERPMNELRGFIYEISHPWMERGWAIMPITLYDKSKDILATLIENVHEADHKAGDNFRQWMLDGERDLGEMHRPSDYPTEAEFKRGFYVGLEIIPVPIRVPSNLLYSLIEEDKVADVAAIRKMIEDSESENLRCVTVSCAKRIFDATKHIIDGIEHKQTPKKPGAKRDNNYRDSLIGNVWDLVQLLPELNLADSKEITDLHTMLKRDILAKLDVENITRSDKKKRMKAEHSRLRENTSLENEVKKEAANIMAIAAAILPDPDDES